MFPGSEMESLNCFLSHSQSENDQCIIENREHLHRRESGAKDLLVINNVLHSSLTNRLIVSENET